MMRIEDVNAHFNIPIELAFGRKYTNHNLPIPQFSTDDVAALEADYTQALMDKYVLSRRYHSLVPPFLKGKVGRPRETSFEFIDTFAAERLALYEELRYTDTYQPVSLEKIFYKPMASVIAYLKHTANTVEYTNPYYFQQVFDLAVADGIFDGREKQRLVAVHAGAGIQEGVWFDTLRDRGFEKKPLYTDGSINMLRVCKAFHPDADVSPYYNLSRRQLHGGPVNQNLSLSVPHQLDEPVICIANNCLPSIPMQSIGDFVLSLRLPKGSLLFATAVNEQTSTLAESYERGTALYDSLFEETFFLARKNMRDCVSYSVTSSGNSSRPATVEDAIMYERCGYLQQLIAGVDEIDTSDEIHIRARIKRHLPVPRLIEFPQINPFQHLHLASSYRLPDETVRILKGAGAKIIEDKSKNVLAFAITL